VRQTRISVLFRFFIDRLAEAIYWLRRIGYVQQRNREHREAVRNLIDRLNQLSIEDSEKSPLLCATDRPSSPSNSEGIGKLESPTMSTTGGTRAMPNAAGPSNRSPEREKDGGSRSRGRSENRRTDDRDRKESQHHHYYRSDSKDSVIIDKFRGKAGEDVDRFLRAVQRRMNRNLETGKYYSEEEQNTDHVALIHRHCGSRVREYIRSLKGNWEEEPVRVTEALTCRYRIFGESAISNGRDKIASLHQRVDEPLERYIRRAQKLTVACEGRDEMHEELTSRFCRGLREKGHRNSLAAMADIWAQIGRTRFETCISNAHRIARSDIS